MTTGDLPPDALYLDAGASTDDRVADLMGRMRREEKLAQLGSAWAFSLLRGGEFSPEQAAPLLSHGLGQMTRIVGDLMIVHEGQNGTAPAATKVFSGAVHIGP